MDTSRHFGSAPVTSNLVGDQAKQPIGHFCAGRSDVFLLHQSVLGIGRSSISDAPVSLIASFFPLFWWQRNRERESLLYALLRREYLGT